MMKDLTVYVGYDPREHDAYLVAVKSIRAQASGNVTILPIVMMHAVAMGFYWRPTVRSGNKLFDSVSQKPMATEFAISRFLIPFYKPQTEWALFVDADVMAMADVSEILDEADPSYAIQCVKHNHIVVDGSEKMDGQIQTSYPRKNWSSVMLWNMAHKGTLRLTLDDVNEKPGLWLHQFGWLEDREIGSIHPAWNYLVGHSDKRIHPKIVHFTDGVPSMKGYESQEYSEIWREWRDAK